MCRTYAEGQGWEVVGELAEDERGQSGADLVTPMLQRAYDMATAGQYDVFVVRDPDRLSRAGPLKHYGVQYVLALSGVRLQFADGRHRQQEGDAGQIVEFISSVFARRERETITRRMAAGKARSVSEGSIQLGVPPLGYDRIETERPTAKGSRRHFELVIDETRAAVVRQIFAWYVDDGLPMREIARKLTEAGVLTVRGKVTWSQPSVRYVLQNETYTGVWHYGRNRPKEAWDAIEVPPIIGRDVWEAAQRQMTRNVVMSKRNAQHEYLLRLRLSCGTCGQLMGGHSKGRYYRCLSQHYRDGRRSADWCENVPYRVDQVDAIAWHWLTETLLQPDAILESYELHADSRRDLLQPTEVELATVERALAKEQGKLDRLLGLYLEGTWDRARLDRQRTGIQSAIDQLTERRRQLVEVLSAETMTRDQAEQMQAFVDLIRDELADISESFADREQLVNLLDVRGRLWVEDGQKLLQLTSRVGSAGDVFVINRFRRS
jgi:site-specific DNA recombinase